MTETKKPLAKMWEVTVTAPNGLTHSFVSDPLAIDSARDPALAILGNGMVNTMARNLWMRREEKNPHDRAD